MTKVSLATIKNWFKTGDQPTESNFNDTFDSFRHKDDPIAPSEVTGLEILHKYVVSVWYNGEIVTIDGVDYPCVDIGYEAASFDLIMIDHVYVYEGQYIYLPDQNKLAFTFDNLIPGDRIEVKYTSAQTVSDDPVYQDFISRHAAAESTLSEDEINALKVLIDELKSDNIWYRLDELYFCVGSGPGGRRQKLKYKNNASFADGQDSNFSVNGIGNASATTSYSTGIPCNQVQSTNVAMGFYLRDDVRNNSRTIFGSQAVNHLSFWFPSDNNGAPSVNLSNNSARSVSTIFNARQDTSFLHVGTAAANVSRYYIDGKLFGTNTAPQVSFNSNMIQLAPAMGHISFYFVSEFLTEFQVERLATLVKKAERLAGRPANDYSKNHVFFVGDGYVLGWGPGNNTIQQNIAQQVATDYNAEYAFANLGVNGRPLSTIYSRLVNNNDALITYNKGQEKNVIFLFAGLNDLSGSTSAGNVFTNLNNYVREARAVGYDYIIVSTYPLYISSDAGTEGLNPTNYNSKVVTLNNLLKGTWTHAPDGIVLLDEDTELQAFNSDGSGNNELSEDGVLTRAEKYYTPGGGYLNLAGHTRWATLIRQKFQDLNI